MINISTYSLRVVKESSGRYDIDSKILSNPRVTVDLVNSVMELDSRAEELLVLCTLDTKNKVTGLFTVSQGSLCNSIVHPREIFKRALLQNSANIILLHNHPSGDPAPSREDINITERIKRAGEIIGIKLLDHIIIGNDCYVSLKEKALI